MRAAVTTQLLTLLLRFYLVISALQLEQSWQASTKSVLVASRVVLSPIPTQQTSPLERKHRYPPQYLLATAGHDSTVRLWEAPFGETAASVVISSTHKGSIFTLASHNDFLLSGSFDKSAVVQNIQKANNGTLCITKIATLPAHTGWVRGVQIVSAAGDERGKQLFFLSIGCNLINVWEESDCGDEATARRLARLDAGPSPGDPEDEMLFRRHDILAITTTDDCSIIVAGLVDGTLRAFGGRWKFWKDRRTPQGDFVYDGTGNCGKTDDDDDDRPCAAVRAHQGRVTGVHTLPNKDEFISVGHDGCWRHWRLDKAKSSFVMLAEGDINGPGGDYDTNDHRICSSVLVPDKENEWSLVVGTIGGAIYRIRICEEKLSSKCSKIWAEAKRGCSITALTWIPLKEGTKQIAVVAGNTNGLVHIFT
jgi:WD40 repeat protein